MAYGLCSAFYFGAAVGDWTDPQNANLWQDGVKTLFDPCPAGWRVPRKGEPCLWSNFCFYVPGQEYPLSNASPSEYVSGPEAGHHYYCTGTSGVTTWYPAMGGRDYRDGRYWLVSNWGMYWTSTIMDYVSYSLHLSYKYTYIDANYQRAYALPVRCVRE